MVQYGTKHIIEVLEKSELVEVREILACGGLSRNRTFVQTQANVAGIPVRTSTGEDPVLVGAAMLAATAGRRQKLTEAAIAMAGDSRTVQPSEYLHTYVSRFHY